MQNAMHQTFQFLCVIASMKTYSERVEKKKLLFENLIGLLRILVMTAMSNYERIITSIWIARQMQSGTMIESDAKLHICIRSNSIFGFVRLRLRNKVFAIPTCIIKGQATRQAL